MSIRAVTVYCSSSSRVPQVYLDAAAELGAAIARQGWTLVYGGNAVGCMAALADAARAADGKVVGVTPEVLVEKGISDDKCDELIVTQTMRERKALMESKGDAFLTLPGGLGTFEEIFEIIVARQLGYHDKSIVLLNIAQYYDPLLAMLDHGIEQQFIKPAGRELIHVTATVAEAIDHLRSHPTAAPPPSPEPSSALE
jgi:uncharacterized protein (TIGR00730 family)